jgi:phosphate acetyltransferase
MAHTFFIAPTTINTGLTSFSMGLYRALDRLGLRVKFLKPIAPMEGEDIQGRSVRLIRCATNQDPVRPMTLRTAQRLMSQGDQDRLLEEVVAMYHATAKDADVVLVEGLEPDRSEHYTARLNIEMAKTLDSEILLVTAPGDRTPEQLRDHVELSSALFGGIENPKLLGVIVNKINAPLDPKRVLPSGSPDQVALKSQQPHGQLPVEEFKVFDSENFKTLGLIPWEQTLVAPRTADIAQYLGAEIINEGDINNRRVRRISLCARTVPNIVAGLLPDTLIVTPGDRVDILIATAMAATKGVPLAGLLLTSGFKPDEKVLQLCDQALASGLPVLHVNEDSYETASQLIKMDPAVQALDAERVDMIMHHMANHIDAEWLKNRIGIEHEVRLSPAAFRYQLVQLARHANKRIVLPEGEEPRTLQAAAICQERGIAQCVLLGKPETIRQVAATHAIELPTTLEIIDPSVLIPEYVAPMVELRKHKNLTSPTAEAQLEDNNVLGTMMLAMGRVDGLVSGAINTTANTIRPALQLIKTAPSSQIVSSVFFMCLPDHVLVYGDCAVNPDPNAEQLADIAIQSADSAKALGIEPRVAMISYSTGSSGSGSDVDKVREATRIAKEKRPELLIDGPLQYDAAMTESVARSKAPNSPVAGRATVLIFPDLNTGNTTYKAVQRSANVISIGPMLQGLRKPVNDLSRGALVEDIVYTIALTAIQAAQNGTNLIG